MAQQSIIAPDYPTQAALFTPDGVNDNWGEAVAKINSNFAELYDGLARVSVASYGKLTIGLGATAAQIAENTATMQAAIISSAALGLELMLPPGTIVVNGLTTRSNLAMRGCGVGVTVIYLANGANNHVLSGDAALKVRLFELTIDGNKANQTAGVSTTRGVYHFNACSEHFYFRVEVRNVQDHGFFFQTGVAGDRCVLMDCVANNVGRLEHTNAGGAGGTGFAGGTLTTCWVRCYANGCYLNGVKAYGRIDDTIVENSVRGGFETGFGVSDLNNGTFYRNCVARNCGLHGFLLQGELDEIALIKCRAEGNGNSGVTAYNGVRSLLIDGGHFKNNNVANAARTATVGRDGISILDNGAAKPTKITITNVTCTGTQECGIYIAAGVTACIIGPGCDVEGNAVQGLYFEVGAEVQISPGTRGHACEASYRSPVTVSGAATNDITVHNIPAYGRVQGTTIKVVGVLTVAGTTAAKTLRVGVGPVSLYAISSQLAAETQTVVFEMTLTWATSTLVAGIITYGEDGGQSAPIAFAVNIPSTNPVAIRTQATTGAAGDSVTQQLLTVETIR